MTLKSWKREGAEGERERRGHLEIQSSGYELGLPPGSVVNENGLQLSVLPGKRNATFFCLIEIRAIKRELELRLVYKH